MYNNYLQIMYNKVFIHLLTYYHTMTTTNILWIKTLMFGKNVNGDVFTEFLINNSVLYFKKIGWNFVCFNLKYFKNFNTMFTKFFHFSIVCLILLNKHLAYWLFPEYIFYPYTLESIQLMFFYLLVNLLLVS